MPPETKTTAETVAAHAVVQESEARAVADVVSSLHAPVTISVPFSDGGAQLLSVPKGMVLHDMKPFEDARRAAPERRKGTVRVTTLPSFIDIVDRYKDCASAIFAIDSPGQPALLAVFDYNTPVGMDIERTAALRGADGPRFGDHRAHYTFPLSDEWKAWTALGARALTQADLAAWLEEHILDVLEPESVPEGAASLAANLRLPLASSTLLMSAARDLTVFVDCKVRSAVNLSTGERHVSYEEAHGDGAGGAVKVPGAFCIAIPVLRGGPKYTMIVRLRYELSKAVITWRAILHRPDAVLQDAFNESVATVESECGLPVYRGEPER